jgi:type III restriction enzyme
MEVYWIPGVNNAKRFGRWAFAELCDVYQIEKDFHEKIHAGFSSIIDSTTSSTQTSRSTGV